MRRARGSRRTFPYILLFVALLIALGFEFVNGFHDTANAVATVIYTHSLPANVATVLLPPTLVSGIFGMNVKDLPLTEGQGGFWWAAAILLGSAVAVCFVLKRMGLIGRR
jgi:phosphate/sulfate permease